MRGCDRKIEFSSWWAVKILLLARKKIWVYRVEERFFFTVKCE